MIVAISGFTSINWTWALINGNIPKDTGTFVALITILISLAISGALGYYLVRSARRIKIQKENDQRELDQILLKPLTEIRPKKALIKPGEKAYGAVFADLQENKTIGYSAGTTGMSVRVAKGVTLRTSGTKGKAVKGMVNIASGELVITDSRVIFAGDRKSFAISLENLLDATSYADGFGFSDNKTTYTLHTNNDKARQIFESALNKVIRG
jgi:hypothetical protein